MNMPSITTSIEVSVRYPSTIKVHRESLGIAVLGFVFKYPRCTVFDCLGSFDSDFDFACELETPILPGMFSNYVLEYVQHPSDEKLKTVTGKRANGDLLFLVTSEFLANNKEALESSVSSDCEKWRKQIWEVVK